MHRSCLLTLVLMSSALSVKAAGLGTSREFLAARQALADGLPEVAALKAERLLPLKSWTRTETRQLATFAAEAWTRASNAARVLNLAEAHDLDEETFWRAQAQVLEGDLAAAREELASSKEQRSPKARLLLAQILNALGEHDAATDEIEPVATTGTEEERRHANLLLAEVEINSGRVHAALQRLGDGAAADDPAANLLRARGHLLSNDGKRAREELQRAMSSTRGGERIHHTAGVLIAETMLHDKQADAAWEHLMKMLDSAAESAVWTESFDLMDRAWTARPEPRVLPEGVLTWIARGNNAQQSPAPSAALTRASMDFRGHATYIIAKWLGTLGRPVEAVSLLESLLHTHPGHERMSAALRLAMQLHIRRGADERALELAAIWHTQFSGGEGSTMVDFLAGDIHFRRGSYVEAQDAFQGAANVATTLSERRRALFNAAVAAVQVSDLVLYLGLLAQLEVAGGSQGGTIDSAADLELDKALAAAASQREDAEESLRTFLTARPYHPRKGEAQIALAEWLLMAAPPRIPEAKAMLDAIQLPAEKSESVDKLRQRLDYTRLWIHEASGDLKALITGATEFAKAWPDSPLRVDVTMKAAGAHFQLDDYASARTQFEIVAKEHPDTPHAETAQYFAALSAMSVMSEEGRARALATWDDLAKKGGPLAVPARRQQALAYRRQGDLESALKAMDQSLASTKLDKETRRLTVCEKAEVLLLSGKKEPKSLDEAVKMLRAFLAEEQPLPFFWRARAGFTLATALRDAKRDSEALEACYDVLRATDTSPPSNAADYLWFSKAGFFGIELLEAAHQWEAAARLAEQIAQTPGNRAEDARKLATKIRLAHFLWDGPTPVSPKTSETQNPPAAEPKAAAPKSEPKVSPPKKKSPR